MDYIVKARPKIPRNKYGYLAYNSTGNITYGSSITVNGGGGSSDLEMHQIWGNNFNGTQDVSGELVTSSDITINNANVNVNGGSVKTNDISTSDGTGTITTNSEWLDVKGGIHAYGDIYMDKDNNQTLYANRIDGREDPIYIDGDTNVTGDLYIDNTTYATNTHPRENNVYSLGHDGMKWLNAYISNIFSSDITTKNLTVTGQAHFFELIIDKIKSIGGSVLLTPADGFDVDIVEEEEDGFKLFWQCRADDKMRDNMWKVGDQALCMSFNQAKVGTTKEVSNKYYWSLVTEIGSNISKNDEYYNFIKISKTDYDKGVNNDNPIPNPEKFDSIVMCGYRGADDVARQSALYLSAYDGLDRGIKAPFIAQYRGINNFDLSSHRQSYFDANGASFFGTINLGSETLDNYITNNNINISNINGDINNINGDINNINGDINNINGDINNINGDITNINGDINNINNDIIGINNDISGINSDIFDLNSDINGINGNITNINTEISGINTNIFNINQDITNINTNISNIKVTNEGIQSTVKGIDRGNILRGTNLHYVDNMTYWWSYPSIVKGGVNIMSTAYVDFTDNGRNYLLEKGKTYTISMDIRCSDNPIGQPRQVILMRTNSATSTSYLTETKFISGFIVGVWSRVSIKFKVEDDDVYYKFRIKSMSEDGETLVRNVMLNEGDLAMKWQPHIDDTYTIKANMLDNTDTFNVGGNLTWANSNKERKSYGTVISAKSENDDAVVSIAEWTIGNNVISTDDDYVFSFYAKGTNVDLFFYNSNGNVCQFTESSASDPTTQSINRQTDGHEQISLTSEWKRYFVHWHTRGTIPTEVKILARVEGINEASLTRVKLENSATITDYTTSASDASMSTNDLQSEILQTRDNIDISINDVKDDLEVVGIHLDGEHSTINVKANEIDVKATDNTQIAKINQDGSEINGTLKVKALYNQQGKVVTSSGHHYISISPNDIGKFYIADIGDNIITYLPDPNTLQGLEIDVKVYNNGDYNYSQLGVENTQYGIYYYDGNEYLTQTSACRFDKIKANDKTTNMTCMLRLQSMPLYTSSNTHYWVITSVMGSFIGHNVGDNKNYVCNSSGIIREKQYY